MLSAEDLRFGWHLDSLVYSSLGNPERIGLGSAGHRLFGQINYGAIRYNEFMATVTPVLLWRCFCLPCNRLMLRVRDLIAIVTAPEAPPGPTAGPGADLLDSSGAWLPGFVLLDNFLSGFGRLAAGTTWIGSLAGTCLHRRYLLPSWALDFLCLLRDRTHPALGADRRINGRLVFEIGLECGSGPSRVKFKAR